MERSLLGRLTDAVDAGEELILCTVVDETGSTPRGRGAAMLVFRDGAIEGTVGGGITEHRVIERARTMLEGGIRTDFFRENLFATATEAALEGAVCGGEISVFLERYGRGDELLIFGAGHIGRALAKLADAVGMKVTTWDEREEFANARNIPWGTVLACPLEEVFARGAAPHPSSYMVIVTRGHALDAEVVKFLEGRGSAYIGMIGSKRKIAFLRERLIEAGVGKVHIDSIYQPVGLPIKAETPEEIAVSILAEIVAVRRGADLKKLRGAV